MKKQYRSKTENDIVLPLRIRGKWDPIVAVWVIAGPLIPGGIILFCLKPPDPSILQISLGGVILCVGIYLYQKLHALVLTEDSLSYRAVFRRWRTVKVRDIADLRMEVGYGPEVSRTGAVARLYLIDVHGREIGVINFGAFRTEEIAVLVRYLKTRQLLDVCEEPVKETMAEARNAMSSFFKQLVWLAIILLCFVALAALVRRYL